MSPPVKELSFSGGELAPYLYARTDLTKYETGLRTERNFFSMRHGGATQRPGSMYVATALNAGAAVRLIPFIFNETGLGQSYVLEFGNQYIAFYQNGGVVVSGGVPYTIVSPYLQADLATLQFSESGDVVTIVHPNYAPQELKRLGATNWTLTPLAYFSSFAANNVTSVTMGGTAGTPVPWNNYYVSAVNSNGEEVALTAFQIAPAAAGVIALATTTTPVTLHWTAPANGAIYYKIYRYTQVGVGAPPYAQGPLGYIGQTTDVRFTDNGITPDFTNAPPIYQNLFTSAGNYPSTVGFIQQRRGFANTINNPIGFWLSVPGDFSNFDVHVTPDDSDGIIATIAGEEVNAIQHLLELKFMLMLTSGAEIYVQGNGNGVVTPSGINASTQSQYGSSPLRPLKVGDVLIFNQALGSFIRDFAFDFSIDGYRGNDISVFSSHLFEGYQLSDWSFQKIPDSLIWAVRSDGTLLSCTYVREQQILAWARHDFTNGVVENVCSIPENGAYAVYLSIKRVINGSTVRYIERLSSRIWTDPLTATYLDCFSSFDGRNTGSTTMTLTASGAFLTTDAAYQQSLTLTASAGFFTSAMVGNEIFLSDATFIATEGASGNQVRCTIQAYTSTTVVTVTPSGAVPAEFQNTAILLWARAVQSVSGLTYLIGQQVSVWADRYLVGSPLNEQISNVYTVPASGILTLDKPYSVIYVGLPMTADLQTLDIETSFGETILAQRKLTGKLAVYVYKTRSFFGGTQDPDTNIENSASDPLFELFEFQKGASQKAYDQAPPLATDQDYVQVDAEWNKNGRIFIRNVDPVPCTILAISPGATTPAPNPAYQKV